jgi:hypothetical protein
MRPLETVAMSRVWRNAYCCRRQGCGIEKLCGKLGLRERGLDERMSNVLRYAIKGINFS